MEKTLLSVGNIIKDAEHGNRYRIIAVLPDTVVLCRMDIDKLELCYNEPTSLAYLASTGKLVVEDEEFHVFDPNTFSEKNREEFYRKKHMMQEVVKAYGPDFRGLVGKKSKPEIARIMKEYNVPVPTFWRICRKYFQGGMLDYALVDPKVFGVSKGKNYSFSKKPEAKTENTSKLRGIARTPEVEKNFEEALKEYKSGRHKSVKSVFDRMNIMHYSTTTIVDGKEALCLLPASERPSYKQLEYYIRTHLTKQEKDAIKTSAAEQRDDKRFTLSDSLYGVNGPGDMVEIDACEADVSLVATYDRNRTVGRPVVYFMIDVYSRAIIAASITFDNNSLLGVTNLFLNLCDDKHKYAARFGIDFDNDALWPSNIIPTRIRLDRGSEFKSKEFGRICNDLDIEKQLVSGASGSLKGTVEQSFHEMHSRMNVHLEDKGLIEKRYDSEHHKEAILDINEYTKLVINFVIGHNQMYDKYYPRTKEMIEQDIHPVPAILWDYGVKKYGAPRPIVNKKQYLFSLMIEQNAKISRSGIECNGLWYLPYNDPVLYDEMFNAGRKKVKMTVRMDPRDVGAIYYMRDRNLVMAPLNEKKTGNADYAGYTLKQLKDIRKLKGKSDSEGRIHNENVSAGQYAAFSSIIAASEKETYSDTKNMRETREADKQIVSHNNDIMSRLLSDDAFADTAVTSEETASNTIAKPKEYKDFKEAIQDMYDSF